MIDDRFSRRVTSYTATEVESRGLQTSDIDLQIVNAIFSKNPNLPAQNLTQRSFNLKTAKNQSEL